MHAYLHVAQVCVRALELLAPNSELGYADLLLVCLMLN
jgi:hypothetical protein